MGSGEDFVGGFFVGLLFSALLWGVLFPNAAVSNAVLNEAAAACSTNGGIKYFRGDVLHGRVFCTNGAEFSVSDAQ